MVVLVSDPAVIEIEQARGKANRIVQKAMDKAVVDDIKARPPRLTSLLRSDEPAGRRLAGRGTLTDAAPPENLDLATSGWLRSRHWPVMAVAARVEPGDHP